MAIQFPIIHSTGAHSFLVLDPSASHLAYALVTMDFNKATLFIENVGMVWTKDSWSRGKRYRYMFKSIEVLASGNKDAVPGALLTEGFFVNPKMMFGSSVIPTINSLIEMTADEKGLGYYELGPSTWRGILGIKPTKNEAGKRDYKVPTANLVDQFVKVPSEIPSNINRKMRKLPNDVTDVLAIAIALGRHHGLNKVSQSNVAFLPFHWLEALSKLAEEI